MRKGKLAKPLLLCSMLCICALWVSGCIEISLKTKIEPNGKCTENIQISTSAMFADGIKTELKKKDFAKEGYQVETKTDGDKVNIIFSRQFNSIAEMYSAKRLDPVSGVEGGKDESKAIGEFKVQDLFFVKTMTFKETTPKVESKTPKDDKEKQMEEMGKQFAQNMFSFKRVVVMPGPIISGNASAIEKETNTATWNIPIDKVQDGYTFEVTSRIINYPAIGAVSVILIVIIVVVIMGIAKKGKGEAPAEVAEAETQPS
ncbi:MAG: hypothetical protein RDV48_15290 [Candidatus Eremiobacteraeota bacterium]|nr:hypothetical protein [Candidatus Eremiobacteraeota bacterium]